MESMGSIFLHKFGAGKQKQAMLSLVPEWVVQMLANPMDSLLGCPHSGGGEWV